MPATHDTFEHTYRSHIQMVLNGDTEGLLADMAPGSMPQVLEGVEQPQ